MPPKRRTSAVQGYTQSKANVAAANGFDVALHPIRSKHVFSVLVELVAFIAFVFLYVSKFGKWVFVVIWKNGI